MSNAPSPVAEGLARSGRGRADPGHSRARTLAALLGAPLTAGIVGAGLARLLPVAESWSAAWGYHVLVPLWVLLACVLPMQRSGLRAWSLCAAIAVPLGAALLVAGPRP